MTGRISTISQVLIRAAVAFVLLVYVLYRIDERQMLSMIRHSLPNGWIIWIPALAATYVGLHCGILRWQSLLNAQGFVISFAEVFRLFFLGQFFNSFMLGACGGDMARAVAVARWLPSRHTAAVTTVIADRAIGLFTTVVFGCVVVALRLPLFHRSPTNRAAAVLMLVFLMGSLLGAAVLFTRHIFERWPFFRRLEQKTSWGPWIRRGYDALFFYRQHRSVVIQAVLYSLVNLLALTCACYLLGRALQVPARIHDYVTFFPVITVLAAVPITPGGLGVRENLFMAMFGSIGTSPERAVLLSVAVYATGLFWSLFGGIFVVVPSRRDQTAGGPSP